ncbi:AAEL017277-PA [Aedes aegypti]|uniref:Odorant receptor n=2 Tax=Aedes aegypti TaxID=7159 RepID=J9HT23_AEDAE|nr:odorant receptor 61 [Aedes aegypti]EJY57788.1 AAEL017277-PA [Aedes aegypti]DAA80400.1 TPA_exp: odorant receptor 61 [Aedes aegypti]
MFRSTRRRFTNWISNKTKLKPDTDVFFLLDYFLVLSGVQLLTKNGYLRTAWNVYRTLLGVHVLLMSRKIWSVFQTEDNFQLIANNMLMCVGCLIIFARCIFIVRSSEQIKIVRRFVNERKFKADDSFAMTVRQNTYNNTIIVTVVMILNCVVQSGMILFTELGEAESLLLPFYLEGLSSSENRIIQKLYSGMFSVYASYASTNFLAVYLPMSTLKVELKVVVDAFEKIVHRVDERTVGKNMQPLEDLNEAVFWEILRDELTQCIRAHGAVLARVKALKKLTDPTFLLLYYMTMLFIAIGVIAVLFTPKFDSFNTISLEYTFRYTMEWYVLCYLVSNFNEEHNDIAKKLSQFHWGVDLRYSKRFARDYKQIRSMVLMVIMQSQKSLNFSCGGLFELTMGSFTAVINKTYTLTTYFWNIKQRG